MDLNSKFPRHSQSVSKLPSTEKPFLSFIAPPSKPSNKFLLEENQKLKKLVHLLKQNLNTSEESLKKCLNDNSNIEYIASQNNKIKSLETRLSETETKLIIANSKLSKLQQELKQTTQERNELQNLIDDNQVKAETYRVMKNKAIECLTKLFSDDPVKSLNFRFMELDNSFLNILQGLLKRYPTIESLDLQGNFITDIGAKTLAELITSTDTNLNELNLNNNKVTIEGAWILLKSIKLREDSKFKRFRKVSLLNNLIDRPSDIYTKINEYIKAYKDPMSPARFKMIDMRRPSYSLNRLFSSATGNVKEIQDMVEVLERIQLTESKDRDSFFQPELLVPEPPKGTLTEIIEDLLKIPKDKDDKKKLKIAAMYSPSGELLSNAVENFIKNGGNVDDIDPAKQETLLMHASRTGHLRLLKKVIALKANLEIKNVKIIQKFGMTAFLIAGVHENYEILSFLAQCGCNIHACTVKGAKAIHLAVKEKKPQTICRLIELGLKVNCKDNHSKTPLHYAARIGDLEIGKLLIQLGAKLNHMDFKGRTPAGLAEEKENFNFADMLEALGGKKIKAFDRATQKNETLSITGLQTLNTELSNELSKADKEYKRLY